MLDCVTAKSSDNIVNHVSRGEYFNLVDPY